MQTLTQSMQVLSIADYHAVMRQKYDKAVSGYDFGKGGFPNIGFYLFYGTDGNERTTGFVATDEVFNKASWGETEKSAVRKYNSF